MIIRPVQTADARALADILSYYIVHTTISFQTEITDENRMEQIISTVVPQYPFLVTVSEEGVVAGFAYAHPWRSYEAYKHTAETTVYLHPDFCGQGIGRALMLELIDQCRAMGLHTIIACITQNNENSKLFHQSLGFSQISHFKAVGFKFGEWLDVLDYQLIL